MAVVACVVGLVISGVLTESVSEPITATVDRVSAMNENVLGSHGGTYFSVEGEVDLTYACYVDTDQSCATLAKGDKIEFTLGSDSNVNSLKHVK